MAEARRKAHLKSAVYRRDVFQMIFVFYWLHFDFVSSRKTRAKTRERQ
jgi:hypothetical protein